MTKWPQAVRRIVEVDNDRYRTWDDRSSPTIRVQQTVPPLIADAPIPRLASSAESGVREATAALTVLRHCASTPSASGNDLAYTLARADAVASARIEHINTSSEALAVALAGINGAFDSDNEDTALVAATVAATLDAHRCDEPITPEWFHRQHRTLMDSDTALLRRHRGAWRDCAVWIGRTRQSAAFEAPPHETVPALVDDLVRFIARSDVHPVVHAALAHAQFETIHPYVDGNGRVGRLTFPPLLQPNVVGVLVPVSHGLQRDPAGYVAGLTAYRDGDIDTWIATFAAAVCDGADVAVMLLARTGELHREYRERICSRPGSSTARILDSLMHTPAITAATIQATYQLTRGRASQILRQFADAGILHRSSHRAGRSHVWLAHDVIHAADLISAIPRDALWTQGRSPTTSSDPLRPSVHVAAPL